MRAILELESLFERLFPLLHITEAHAAAAKTELPEINSIENGVSQLTEILKKPHISADDTRKLAAAWEALKAKATHPDSPQELTEAQLPLVTGLKETLERTITTLSPATPPMSRGQTSVSSRATTPPTYIHTTWMGRMPEPGEMRENVLGGITSLVTRRQEAIQADAGLDNSTIIMWCQPGTVADLSAALSARLDERGITPSDHFQVKSIDSLYSLRGQRHIGSLRTPKKLQKSITTLGNFRAYAAQKDLVSLAVLLEYGGIHLDTTTQISDFRVLVDTMRGTEPEAIKVVGFENSSGAVVLQHPRTLEIAEFIDVWMMFAKEPGNPHIKTMMKAYLDRVERWLPPDTDCFSALSRRLFSRQPSLMERTRLLADTSDECRQILNAERPGRDNLLGNLIILSVYDGLRSKFGSIEEGNLDSGLWKATPIANGYRIDALGPLDKRHCGMWRVANMVAREAALEAVRVVDRADNGDGLVEAVQRASDAMRIRELAEDAARSFRDHPEKVAVVVRLDQALADELGKPSANKEDIARAMVDAAGVAMGSLKEAGATAADNIVTRFRADITSRQSCPARVTTRRGEVTAEHAHAAHPPRDSCPPGMGGK